jgi:CheY-like chemotaxis protein
MPATVATPAAGAPIFVRHEAAFSEVVGEAPVLTMVVDAGGHEGPVYVADEDPPYYTTVPSPVDVRCPAPRAWPSSAWRPPAAAATDRAPAGAAGAAPTVLAIDDDPLAVELLRATLGAEGYRVVAAAGGEEGVTLARRKAPALVVLDLLMPGADGFAVVERLRADPAAAAVPIVILTAKTMTAADKARLNGRLSLLVAKGAFSRAGFVALVRRLCPGPNTEGRVH